MMGIKLMGFVAFGSRCALLAACSFVTASWFFDVMDLGVESLSARIAGVAIAIASGIVYFLLAVATRTQESQIVWDTFRGFLKRN